MSLFVDTSIWYAAVDTSDDDNARAINLLTGEHLITTDHVLVESWRLLHHRLGRGVADQFWEGLRKGAVAIEPVGLFDLDEAWQIGRDWPDQDFSIVDRTSFAVMLRLGLQRVASLDEHFVIFRFGPRRRRSFEIVR